MRSAERSHKNHSVHYSIKLWIISRGEVSINGDLIRIIGGVESSYLVEYEECYRMNYLIVEKLIRIKLYNLKFFKK